MTTSNTRDAEATAAQCLRLYDSGCDIVRVTVQGIKEAEACEEIKNILVRKGCPVPLVADIHFFPPAALKVADFVEKIRVNPGNFADKRASFKTIEYNDNTYADELKRVEEKFLPLVEKCRRLKRAMRIGTNHGSLSDRVMNRYGDTPAGMVESAFEFARICRSQDYHNFLFSMKASNPLVMIEAYRLLVREMDKMGWEYPLHLGVTEAGDGEDGRIKSALGMGALLIDGIGDTVRVSLTEDPWNEIEPCKELIKIAETCSATRPFKGLGKREVAFSRKLSTHAQGTVIAHPDPSGDLKKLGFDQVLGQPKIKKQSVDIVLSKEKMTKLEGIGVSVLMPIPLQEAKNHERKNALSPFGPSPYMVEVKDEWDVLKDLKPDLILFSPTRDFVSQGRAFREWLDKHNSKVPVILGYSKGFNIMQAAAELGALFCEGFGNGIYIKSEAPAEQRVNLSFNILQAARLRITKTDFISCPSCGRTLFDLQEVTQKIKEKTAHLDGVKIAIMGCIVNGPGEMADADFGYVGSKPEKIDLYVGKTVVAKDIDFHEGPDKLVELIKSHGRWQEPA